MTTENQLQLFDTPQASTPLRQGKPRPKVSVKEKCPGCLQTRYLIQGHYARLCAECHDSITEMAARRL